MLHFSRSALAGTAAFGMVIAAGCSSAAPTPTPITDPQVLFTQSLGQASSVTSFHLKVDVSGKVNTGSLSGSAAGGAGLGGNMDLAGTSVEGDVDVKNSAADLKLSVPGLLGLTGEAIVVNGDAYYKISLQGDKFTKVSLSDLAGSLPVSVPSALPSGSGALTDEVAQLRQQLQDAGVTTTMMPDDKVGDKAAYHVRVNLPLDKINTLLASSGGASAASMQLDSAGLDFWAYKDTTLPAKLEIKGSSGSLGNLDVVVMMTNYNKSVTINAPDPSQVQG